MKCFSFKSIYLVSKAEESRHGLTEKINKNINDKKIKLTMRLKKTISLLLIVFLLNILSVLSFDYRNSENLYIDMTVRKSVKVLKESSDYSLKSVDVSLDFYPRDDYQQDVIDLELSPDGDIEDEKISYIWEGPTEDEIFFGFTSEVQTFHRIKQVKEKIRFPLREVSEELETYTKPSETIDSDDEDIIFRASHILKGEDDYYEAVFKIAEWTKKNVEYDLSTITAEASQKASWVLRNKEGVCDEITSLFIALLRSVSIPAKFVSGLAYTNSELFEEEWGPHGWAEVYFPDTGWVAFDVTYGEYGFIDAGHVKMKESIDSAASSTEFSWLGRNINLQANVMETTVKVKDPDKKVSKVVSFDVKPFRYKVGIGSYNLIEVKIKNLKDYYITTELYLSKSENIENVGENIKSVLLKPKEEKTIFWVVKVSENLQKNFIYNFPFLVSSLRNTTAKTSFSVDRDGLNIDFNEIMQIKKSKEEEEVKSYSKDLILECNISDEEFYSYEKGLVICKVRNTGNVGLKDLNLCFEGRCEKTDLFISQTKYFNWTLEDTEAGKKELSITAKNSEVSKADYVSYSALDKPEIDIDDINAPLEVKFDDNFILEFLLTKASFSKPVNVNLELEYNGFTNGWVIKEFDKNKKYEVGLSGSVLKEGMNQIKINVKYQDSNNKEYAVSDTVNIKLIDVSFLQKVQIFFIGLEKYIVGFSFESLSMVGIIAGIFFVFVVLFVFRRK